MDDLRVRAELRRTVDHPVIEACAHGQNHIGMVHGQVGGVAAVHAEHAEELPVAARIATEPHQGIGHWQVEQARQLGQRRSRIAHDHAAAGVDDRPLGGQQHFRRLADLPGVATHGRTVGTQLDLLRIDVLELVARVGHVLGDVHHHRTGAAGLGDIESLLQYFGDFRRMLDDEAVLHDRPGNTDHVGFLEGIGTDHGARHLAGQHHHGDRIHIGGGNAGDGIGRTRTGSHQHHAGLAGRARVAIGHMGRGLFVADEDVLDRLFLEQGIVDMQKSTTRVPVDVLHAFVAQEADDHFSA
ncbi:hypothetical protein D3C80_953100 [compost metagenome]